MATEIITKEDLMQFKIELLEEIEIMIKKIKGEPDKKWLKSKEVRKILNISPGTLQSLRINGSLPYTKIGGSLFYKYEDIVKMIEENRIETTSIDLKR